MTDELDMKRSPSAGLVALALWIVTSAIGFWLLLRLLDMVVRIYAAFWGESGFYSGGYWQAVALRQFMVLPLGILLVALIIGSGEYYYRNYGEPGSWTWMRNVIAVEVALMVLSAIL